MRFCIQTKSLQSLSVLNSDYVYRALSLLAPQNAMFLKRLQKEDYEDDTKGILDVLFENVMFYNDLSINKSKTHELHFHWNTHGFEN